MPNDPQAPVLAPAPETPRSTDRRSGPLRLRRPNREQVAPVPVYLDALVADDHLARLLWQAVEPLDLTAFTQALVVVEGGPGRAAADPRLLVALWLYATSQGVSTARELARLCVEHLAYIWLCGGVSVNYHTLSDFRVQHGAALDDLMTAILGRLDHAGLITLERVAQDGIRVRASAGAASFRRQPTLEKSLAEARAVLEAVRATEQPEDDDDDDPSNGPPTARQRAARERAARERVERIEAALAGIPAARAAKKAKGEEAQARVSTTDAEARVMKMADGGFRPAYNLQFATQTGQPFIVGVAVTASGTDAGQAPPMVEQVIARTDQRPGDWLMDGSFADLPAIDAVARQEIRVLAPVRPPRNPATDPFQPRPGDTPEVIAWRARMATAEGKETYKLRAATSEWVNAQARTLYGLTQLPVRGLAKVRCIALWIALTHNILRGLAARLGGAAPARAVAA